MAITLSNNVSGGAVSKAQNNTHTGDQTVGGVVTIADSTTDQLLTISIDVSLIKALYFHSNQALTVETNAIDATGGNTVVLVADHPLVWDSTTQLYTNLLTLDITKMYITNASGATATLTYVVEQDSTP